MAQPGQPPDPVPPGGGQNEENSTGARAHSPDDSTITAALEAYRRGDDGASDRLHELMYDQLRRIAHQQRNRIGRDQSLQSTEIVHEAYAKIAARTREFEGRSHFLAFCSSTMRHILVDAARKRLAEKRGGGERAVTLEDWLVPSNDQAEKVIAVSQAMQRLEHIDERLARVVDCRYFAGLTEEETAAALESSRRTVQRDWLRARAWLKRSLEDSSAEGSEPDPGT